ncbi:MAG TPA: site-specific integrase, partial [Pirellulales bacterium]
MAPSKPVALAPAQPHSAGSAKPHPWATAFLAYLRSECGLAGNTVEAYGRDLAHFFEWLAGRSIPKLTIRDLSDYPGWLQEQG